MSDDVLGPGQIFAGRYRIERFLAQGGFGAVYVAEQLATETRVAVKVLWPHVLQARDAVEKFEQEARIAGRVNSDHIVRMVDAGYDDSTHMPFLVMELLEGEDLGQRVERDGALPPETVVEYLRQTASALDRAHSYVDREGVSRPIVHRDLKPENLYLARRDDGGITVKVLDFGIAKILNSTSDVSREVKGTPLFMAFEQASGAPITPRTDVWALGLIAFYLLTGQNYWNTARVADASLMQLFAEVLSLPLVPASARLAEIGHPAPLPPAFDTWFQRCVNRDSEQRFASAGQAVAELAAVFGIAPMLSRSEPSLMAGAVAAGGFAAAPGATSSPAVPARTVGTPAAVGAATDQSMGLAGTVVSSKASRSRAVPIAVSVLALLLVGGGIAFGVSLTRNRAVAATATSAVATQPTVAPEPPKPTSTASAAPVASAAPSAAASASVVASASSAPSTPTKQANHSTTSPRPVHHVAQHPHHAVKPSKDIYGER